MKVGDLIRVSLVAHISLRRNLEVGRAEDSIRDLDTGIIIEIDSEELGKDNVVIFTKTGEIKEYSRNITSLQFEVINEVHMACKKE